MKLSKFNFMRVIRLNKKEKLFKKKGLLLNKRFGGRNNQGRITVRHQGGGHKQYYRDIL